MNIRECVEPLRIQAVKKAEDHATNYVQRVINDLFTYEWDLEKAAPYPWSSLRMPRREAQIALRKYNSYKSLTTSKEVTRRRGEPDYVDMDEASVIRYVDACKEAASAQYTAFIAKLEMKVGDHVSATIQGSHVWGYSILTVQKVDGVERWKTQQIENVSKNGLYFPQWPSRKMR
jgi:hypothetical protein